MKKSDEKNILSNLIETGADITGNIASAAVGGLIAGPEGFVIGGASGPIVTRALKKIGLEIKQRLIGPREEVRIGAVYTFAIQKIHENLKGGKDPG